MDRVRRLLSTGDLWPIGEYVSEGCALKCRKKRQLKGLREAASTKVQEEAILAITSKKFAETS